MDLLTLNQFAVLLWKNFTLKRRQFINLIMEVLTALVFPVMLLLFRLLETIKVVGPFNFTSHPISTLPYFLKNPEQWELIYVPSDIDVIKEITENVKRNLNISIKVKGFSSETEFEKYIKYDYGSRKVLAAIIFDYDFKNSSDPLPLQVKYHLRFVRIQRTVWWPDRVGWRTSLLFPSRPSVGPRNVDYQDGGSPGYLREGFLAVQHALDKAIMLYHESTARQKLFDGISIFVQRFPYPAYPHDELIGITSNFFPLMFILMFSPTVLSIMRSVVWEREKGLKEYQLIIGLRNWMIWAAYFFTFFLFYIIIIILICVLFFAKIVGDPIFRYSDYSFIFIFLMCYSIASIFFGFMISTFFSKARLTASAGNLLYFASFFPFNSLSQHYGQLTLTKKVAACLSSNVALALGVNLLLRLELKQVGAKWDNLWTPANLEDNLVFGYMLGMLLLDAFLYGFVTWYVETVFPGQYGVPQPWYFFLMHSYWFGQPTTRRENEEMKCCGRNEDKYFQAEPPNLVAGIQIKHLHKVVILDEPSSSMDPVSRRVIWDLLQENKHNRTILLTTHYMDEAEILGDRIAIMVKGTLQCCGSSVFLKQIYGAGYHIVLEREPHCDVEKVSAMIQSHIPDATLENCTGAELSFILPKEYAHRFEALFNDLEKTQKQLGIASFGASITTMEEVFLKAHKLADSEKDIQPIKYPSLKSQKLTQDMKWNVNMSSNYERPVFSRLNEIATIKFNTGFPLYCQQFRSMFIKRALFSWRNWKLILLQTTVILIVTTYLLLTTKLQYELPAREMDLSQYGRTIVPYSISGNSELAMNLTKNLKIFLNAKNQELREVQGNIVNYILENKECHDFSIIALSIEVEKNETIFTILFNNEAYHSAATSLAVLDNILFMSLSGPNASIEVYNKPQPPHIYGSNVVPTSGSQIVLCLAFGMAVVVSSFCLQTVTERTTNAKHIQFVSGVYILTYWLSALLWDLICFSISCCLLLGVFKYCGIDAFVADYHFLDTMMIFMLYGWSVVPLMYLGSFLFSSSTTAYVKLTLFNYFSTVFSMITYILWHLSEPDSIGASIENVLMVLPSYNFAMSISRFFDDYEVKKICARKFPTTSLHCSKTFTENNIYSFGENGIAKFLISSAAMGLFYLLLLLCMETTFWRLKNFFFQKIIFNVYNILMKGRKAMVSIQVINELEDPDIENERKKVLALPPKLKNTPLLFKELTKIYYKCPVVKAVRNISLVVKKSECFGLLGLNGAGKTTTFKMLTGEETITSGVVLIDGISITENIRKVRSRIGYCPQSDPMLNHMTGRELLIMYARLRGVPEPDIYKYVETFLHSMHLETQADKFVNIYSRGNKRKLNTAIALMGNSSVVFLDEPSTGMDPVARHLLWDAVTWMCKSGKAIIITSHSMEECEALCTRLAIMVKGRFKCLGSRQHLKNKFGNVYRLTAKINIDKNEDKLGEFKNFIATAFPGNKGKMLKQKHQGIVGYHIPGKEICWGKMFSILEEAKVLFNLEDYSVSQITLEHIFLSFANTDKTENEQEIKVV
ncbi:phospholipid-transporting ATPase ABCA3-like isoform X19 [Equus przewalskii]|uniref:Phospholipid-transporting ATPase ABCA3-like isoform X19 n=1 Tax=Equus przewalskii TaxID=9798 RepID=A0ABM4K8J9_EQUPR